MVNEDDSDSDVSMSADTDDEEEDQSLDSTPKIQPSRIEAPRKRKHSGSSVTPNELLDVELSSEPRKRMKPAEPSAPYRTSVGCLYPDKSLLPAEIWHHIFIFCHPKALGLLLQVNRLFNAYIDSSSIAKSPVIPHPTSALQLLLPDAIWRASRVLFRNGMPGPLDGKSELEMWRLACSTHCQFCDKPNSPGTLDQWHPGPGSNGVARIWSFGIRACGLCLTQKSTKVETYHHQDCSEQ